MQKTASTAVTKEDVNPENSSDGFAMFNLNHTSADNVRILIQQMFPDRQINFTADPRTNTLFVTADNESIALVGELLQILDVPAKGLTQLADSSGTPSTEQAPIADRDFAAASETSSDSATVGSANETLSEITGDHSSHIEQTMKQLKDWQVNVKRSTVDLKALKATVTKEFELRQKLQLEEIKFLRSRLEDLELRVRQKDLLKSQIIERRVKSLLATP